jgi:hypothetical protein
MCDFYVYEDKSSFVSDVYIVKKKTLRPQTPQRRTMGFDISKRAGGIIDKRIAKPPVERKSFVL